MSDAPAQSSPPRAALAAIGALAVGAFLVTGWFVAQRAYSLYDDAYIYFRYAENLVAGHGLRWNIADAPVEGFTGPLFLALLAAGALVGAELEAFAQLLGVVFVGGATALATTVVYQLGRAARVRRRDQMNDAGASTGSGTLGEVGAIAAALLCWLALSTDHFFQLNAVIGLETGLAALLGVALLASATLWDCRGLRTLLVLAVLTRPECALFSAAALMLPKARSVRWLGPLAAAAVAIAALRYAIFHDVLPNTFYAKAGGTAAHAELGVDYIVTIVRQFPAVVVAPLALLDRRARLPVAWFLLVSLVWFAHFLRTGGDFFPFSRLAIPLVAGLTALAAHGLHCLALTLREQRARLGVLAVVTALAGAGIFAQFSAHRLAPMNGFPDVRYWTAVGRWLGENHPDARVATTTIGAVGYFSDLHVYDIVGLTQPEVAKDGELIPAELTRRNYIGHEKHNTAWIIAERPDIILFEREAAEPWTDLQATRATYYAEWALLQEIKSGRLPYRLYSPQVDDGRFALMFVSPEYIERVRSERGIDGEPGGGQRGGERSDTE